MCGIAGVVDLAGRRPVRQDRGAMARASITAVLMRTVSWSVLGKRWHPAALASSAFSTAGSLSATRTSLSSLFSTASYSTIRRCEQNSRLAAITSPRIVTRN